MADSGLGTLKTDALFLGLTRPAMLAGVTYTYFAMEFFVSIIIFVMTSNFKVFLFTFFAHGFGMVLCKREPLAIDMLLNKTQKTPATFNKSYHGGLQSYNMFE